MSQATSNFKLDHKYDNVFGVLHWPPQSLDPSSMEKLWIVVEGAICSLNVQLTDLQQLHDVIMSTWSRITEECFQHLVGWMPVRIQAVLRAKQ